jgi:hypothetical protein
MPTKPPIVKAWLTELAGSLKPTMTQRELDARIRNSTRDLAARYPTEAFTPPSRLAVAAGLDGFPTSDEIASRLAAWWRDNASEQQQSPSVLPGGEDPALTIEDRHHLRSWFNLKAEGFKHRDGDSSVTLSVMRQYRPRVFDYICRTNPEAEKIAMHRGWLRDTSERRTHSEYEIASIEQSTARALSALPGYRRTHPVNEQREHVAAPAPPPGRTRQDDLAMLANLRADVRLTNRGDRIRSLCAKLNVPELGTDPAPLPPPDHLQSDDDTPWTPRV